MTDAAVLDDEFLALVCADPDLLAAEFDAIMATVVAEPAEHPLRLLPPRRWYRAADDSRRGTPRWPGDHRDVSQAPRQPAARRAAQPVGERSPPRSEPGTPPGT